MEWNIDSYKAVLKNGDMQVYIEPMGEYKRGLIVSYGHMDKRVLVGHEIRVLDKFIAHSDLHLILENGTHLVVTPDPFLGIIFDLYGYFTKGNETGLIETETVPWDSFE